MDQPIKFRRIGAGFCGSVWAPPGGTSAFKREDGGPGRSLKNDFEMHQRVLRSLDQQTKDLNSSLSIQIPLCYQLIDAEDGEWWDKNHDNFPEGYSACKTLHSERIPPFPRDVREFLIDKYCPASLIAEIKSSDANQDCLIRPYLGRRRLKNEGRNRPSRLTAFSLRNFPLHVDQMEELGIETDVYAKIMAETLAIMHWDAKVDANDVEFVLAPVRSESCSLSNGALGQHGMWILDFDCCRDMPMNSEGVDQAVAAFFRNDPFYPRPGSHDGSWEVFRDQYLQTSFDIIRQANNEDTRLPFPRMFIENIEGRLASRLDNDGLGGKSD
ncbi:hypothetical protein FQN54_006667 [Arachnomyces sp. PD_36]|nr:hypothetical protein FQN54_006667 [Arachnomyces sp. PD_36]